MPSAARSADTVDYEAEAVGCIVAQCFISWETARDALGRVAPKRRYQRELATYLKDTPNALTSGASSTPPIVDRLIVELTARGASGLQRPRCALCGEARDLRYRWENGRICSKCFIRNNKAICAVCGKLKPVDTRTADGQAVCAACRMRDQSAWETCDGCGRRRRIMRRLEGRSLCQRCYQRPEHTCGGCGRRAAAHAWRDGIPLCKQCYRSPDRLCSKCGRMGRIAVRSVDGESDVCLQCYRAPEHLCAICGQMRICAKSTDGRYLCTTCRPRPSRLCVQCGRTRPAQAIWPEGPVCSTCYDRGLNEKAVCSGCGATRRIVTAPPLQLCSDCAQVEAKFVCGGCGAEGRLYERGMCARCVLSRRLDELLRDHQGEMLPQFAGVYEALVSVPIPRSALHWLQRGKGAVILRELISGHTKITHELLDEQPASRELSFLRDLLVATGALPQRDRDLANLESWMQCWLNEFPLRREIPILEAFTRWEVLRRLRFKSRIGKIHATSAKWARVRLKLAGHLLIWLEAQGKSLENCTQPDIDAWLVGGRSTRYGVRAFIVWARKRGLLADVQVPGRPHTFDPEPITTDARVALVKQLFEDSSIAVTDRVAGCLVLLYGQTPGRLSRLRVDDVQEDNDRVYLRLGRDRLELSDPLSGLVQRLVREQTGRALVRGPARHWLFPGGHPGQPMAADSMRNRLANIGVVIRPARSSALTQLASEVPAVVLGDLLGLHYGTAVRWVRQSGGDWARYIKLRMRQ